MKVEVGGIITVDVGGDGIQGIYFAWPYFSQKKAL